MAPSRPNPPNPDAIFDALISDRNDPAALRKRVEPLEILLERSFVIPGINRPVGLDAIVGLIRSEEHTSELQSLMRISYAVLCLNKKNTSNYPASLILED